MEPYVIHAPTVEPVPILVSVPHCGTAFPDELKGQFDADLTTAPDDTDWFVNKLYDFAPHLGMTLVTATYSRWVIDLNRDPQSKPLYTDGRIITGLCPTTTFLGEPLYVDKRTEVTAEETERRLQSYYWPYHHQLQQKLHDLKTTFGKVLLWDCHSIRQYVQTIYKENFPDLILGDADGTSAAPAVIETAYRQLGSGPYSLSHNFPFKGGFITRHYGKPLEHQYALQLEMSKIRYMNDTETLYDETRANAMRALLEKTLMALVELLQPKRTS
ncbi:N-formylglutamate amidohydrolase [Chryseolinea lacunae]|uniref:N-formylglutamate amidohydrolase n=1 Tax=Chryseolinea lacunae TaxID=2801331 RepID=A0ABS1KQJ1_9BACT|nr:N-formylglutamate amidohydrolase [Chryseolinea lacunae]MBL0741745.1 N-formylglutamate amidohydrolase [Chryseolinea lacunae]